ncbi:MAG: Asp-tRNA(Asn)/Glu-tRNA(Gln) amidotransferase subunit GatB [Candidatus Porifericomitaceae bacterium WSBS_2022_MAG_OTU9]
MNIPAATASAWQTVIGLEVHVQLATKSKLFSSASNCFGEAVNSMASAVDVALPGTLPVINRQALQMAIKFALAVGGEIAPQLEFARKNYFYPDLPKGYQISQHEMPIVKGGAITLPGGKQIGLERAHLEEDAGKSVHENIPERTGIDLNRAGVPLLEIVSLPVMHSVEEAVQYMKEVHTIVRMLGISSGNMERGEFRCDANVSVRPAASETLGERTEIKNVNSFRFVGRALEYEIARHTSLYEQGQTPQRETRLYDAGRNQTRAMRGKELAADYRYFPDPDLPQMAVPQQLIDQIAKNMPELPAARRSRYHQQHGLDADTATALAANPAGADYFDACLAVVDDAKLCANWITNELFSLLNKRQCALENCPVAAVRLAGLLQAVQQGLVSQANARKLLALMWEEQGSAEEMIEHHNMRQINDSDQLESLVADVIKDCPEQVQQYLAGKAKVLGFMTGQIMKRGGGNINPGQANKILRHQLEAMKKID